MDNRSVVADGLSSNSSEKIFIDNILVFSVFNLAYSNVENSRKELSLLKYLLFGFQLVCDM